jgi:ferredoxin
MSETIRFTLDGREVEAAAGETIWQVAKRVGTDIPHLCYRDEPGYRSDGNCRACMVEIDGERVLAASCIRRPQDGMVVKSQSDRAATARRMVMELLVADQPARSDAHDQTSTLGAGPRSRTSPPAGSRRATRRSPTRPTRQWRSISTPASTATCACAPAARCRSTT